MSALDAAILGWVNGFAGRWPALDHLAIMVASSHLLKGGVMMTLLWWAWFTPPASERRRVGIVAAFVAVGVAIPAARVLQLASAYRPRPVHDPLLGVHVPIGMPVGAMSDWSSFPSDHATAFFALAVALFAVSRRLGAIGCVWALLVVSLPRVYLGWHYPSDIAGGAVLGAATAVAVRTRPLLAGVATPIAHLATWRPQAFYACLFLLTFQFATLLEDARTLLSFMLHP
jgi:undecaprenyl-diphosphatase